MNTLIISWAPIDAERKRNGHNAAFGEPGLEWFRDAETDGASSAIREPKRWVGVCIHASHLHLLRARRVDCLARAVETMRARFASGAIHR